MSGAIEVRMLLELPAALAAVEELRREVRDLRREMAELKRTAPSSDELVTLAEAAVIEDVKLGAMRKRAARGRLPVVRRGRSLFVRRGDLGGGAV